MTESADWAAILALIVVAIALKLHDLVPRMLLWAGALLLAGAWLPIVTAGLLGPWGEYIGHALGLGLLAWFGSTLGLFAITAGILWQIAIVLQTRAR